MMSDTAIVIILSLLSSAFFAGLEIAFLTSNKLRIELESNQGFIPARILSKFVKEPSKFIATTLVGNNIALVVYGIYMAEILEPIIEIYIHNHFFVLALQVLVSTIIVITTAEFLPKALFRSNPNGILNFLAIPFIIIYYILFPVVYITIELSESLLAKVFKVNLSHNNVVFSRVDLDTYVRQFTSDKSPTEHYDHEIQIFQNALDFSAVRVRECMIPRTEIISIEVSENISTLRAMFVETRLSKILVYSTETDNIIGYVHSNEMFRNPASIKSILRPIAILPETLPAKDALAQLKHQRKSIAIVVDEFGAISGLLTVEDLMEEIFGDINDEHDVDENIEKQLSELEYLFSGRLEIDYLNQKYNFKLPIDEGYETLAGLVLHAFESVPKINEETTVEGYLFKVTALHANRITEIQVKILE
jgi:CBS domain containing-hemolysin-like protein